MRLTGSLIVRLRDNLQLQIFEERKKGELASLFHYL